MRRIDPLLEETFVASLAMSCLGAAIVLLFWLLTGLSPWPIVVLGVVGGFGWGVFLLALTSPARRR